MKTTAVSLVVNPVPKVGPILTVPDPMAPEQMVSDQIAREQMDPEQIALDLMAQSQTTKTPLTTKCGK